jgi:hypothetical protein
MTLRIILILAILICLAGCSKAQAEETTDDRPGCDAQLQLILQMQAGAERMMKYGAGTHYFIEGAELANKAGQLLREYLEKCHKGQTRR